MTTRPLPHRPRLRSRLGQPPSHRLAAPLHAIPALLLAALVVGACLPGGSTPAPSPAATSAVAPSSDALGGQVPGSPVATLQPTATPVATSTPATPATPTATPTTTTPLAWPPSPTSSTPPQLAQADPEPFDMNLYRKGDFVAQYTFEWCVGASLQMAMNMATNGSYTSKGHQQKMWEMAQARSDSPFGGANPRGWTAALNELGIGPYVLVSLPSFEEAVELAAQAIRDTDRPVGLVMWRGRHAWVMSGFESTADPARFDEFDVTRIRVMDPLYPHGSTVWGASPKPNGLLTPEQLAEQYVMRDSRRVNLGVPPGWLLILPTTTEA